MVLPSSPNILSVTSSHTCGEGKQFDTHTHGHMCVGCGKKARHLCRLKGRAVLSPPLTKQLRWLCAQPKAYLDIQRA